jgi:hypothetical protein
MANPMYGQNKFDDHMPNVLIKETYGTSGTTHTNSTAAADLFSYSIAANTLEVGDIIRIKIYAQVTDNNSTDTLTPVINFGGTAICTGASLDVADGDLVWAEADIHVTKIGSAGSMQAFASLKTDAGGSTFLGAMTVLTSKDTTGALAVALNVDWSVAHAENIVRLDAASIEIL